MKKHIVSNKSVSLYYQMTCFSLLYSWNSRGKYSGGSPFWKNILDAPVLLGTFSVTQAY